MTTFGKVKQMGRRILLGVRPVSHTQQGARAPAFQIYFATQMLMRNLFVVTS